MNAPAASRRSVAAPRWALACGLAACGAASAQEPAARLGAVRPAGPVIARGGSPEIEPKAPPAALPPSFKPKIFETFEDRAKTTGTPPKPATAPAPVAPAGMSAAPAKPKSMFDASWKDIKSYVAPEPAKPFTPAGSQPPAPAAQPPQAVYAGPPAYRWFGWGTTTPGANPYAPNGQYPQASANWYAQTGATPGAFPTQVAQAVVPPPGAQPPQYAPTPFHGAMRTQEPFFIPPPAEGPYAVPSMPLTFGGYPTTYVPTDLQPIAQSPPGQPVVGSVELPPPSGLLPSIGPPGGMPVLLPTAPDVQWQPVGARPQPQQDIVPTAGWTQAGPSLEDQIRTACKDVADVIAVRSTGPNRLTVRFAARTESHARVAADEVLRLPSLRGYEVAFEAKFGDR